MFNKGNSCPIWGTEYSASVRRLPGERIIEVTDSPRAGGAFTLTYNAEDMLGSLSEERKVRLTTWLVDQRSHGVELPEITLGVVKYVETKRPLPVYQRAERLLRYLAEETRRVGDFTKISVRLPANGTKLSEADTACYRAMAWSETMSPEEVYYFLNYLVEKGWVRSTNPAHIVTVDGYSRIAELENNVDSSQAFVAMWFDESMNPAYDEGIRPAIEEAGYSPIRIDRKDYIGKVDDEIIAEIRRSRFLVADFTQGDGGARGGVYYEAGFAYGLNLPVICTCQRDSFENVHFDTNHINHIVWTDAKDLRDKLKSGILAVICEGPRVQTTQ